MKTKLASRRSRASGAFALGTALYDEFRLSSEGHLIHEIEWAGVRKQEAPRWIIGASDVEFRWIPQVTSANQ